MRTIVIISCMVAVMMCLAVQNTAAFDEAATLSVVTCQKGSLVRTVEVTYAGEQGQPPCEVHYKKTVEQPGHDEVLWNSEHTRDYCETKQQEFVEKLQSWNWTCE